jgi:hypothetical protein
MGRGVASTAPWGGLKLPLFNLEPDGFPVEAVFVQVKIATAGEVALVDMNILV